MQVLLKLGMALFLLFHRYFTMDCCVFLFFSGYGFLVLRGCQICILRPLEILIGMFFKYIFFTKGCMFL